jgi:signal peptidase I
LTINCEGELALSKGKGLGRLIFEAVQIVVFALVLSWGLRSAIVEARVVPTGSMLPTIQLQDRVIVDKIVFKFRDIKHGDVVVFHPPSNIIQKDDLLKRVIGLPGDKVEIKDGKVFINDLPLNESYILEQPKYQYGPVKVPESSFFVLGDNRNDSNDSHNWGMLSEKNLVGKAILVYWPINRFGQLK